MGSTARHQQPLSLSTSVPLPSSVPSSRKAAAGLLRPLSSKHAGCRKTPPVLGASTRAVESASFSSSTCQHHLSSHSSASASSSRPDVTARAASWEDWEDNKKKEGKGSSNSSPARPRPISMASLDEARAAAESLGSMEIAGDSSAKPLREALIGAQAMFQEKAQLREALEAEAQEVAQVCVCWVCGWMWGERKCGCVQVCKRVLRP